jgi:uncharacterized protein YndB with AHSA1/START domain
MDATVVVNKTIETSPEAAWAAVRGIDGLDRWFPIIASCRVEGTGIGAMRILGLDDGGELHDRVDEIDDQARRFRYLRTVHPFPATRYVGTVEVRERDAGLTAVTWALDIDVDPDARDELVAFLGKAISDGLDGMARELERKPA